MLTAWELLDSWRGEEIVADKDSGAFLSRPEVGTFDHSDEHFEISGRFNVPRGPQGRPVIFQAGDSDEGREFAAETADAIFTRHSSYKSGRAFYADIKGRLARYGRGHDELVVLPATTFVLGETDAEAEERSRHVREQQVSGPTAIKLMEQVWNRDLSDYDPDGPLPDVAPLIGAETIAPGRASVRMNKDPVGTVRLWRELATAKSLSIRQLMIEVSARQSFVGSATTIAENMERFVRDEVCDGFILVPHITPGGLDDFAKEVVPLLQERGLFRADYEGTTLREHLGLPPVQRDLAAVAKFGALGSALVSSIRVPLSVLDLVPVASGSTAAEAVRNSIGLARRAESLGYSRYWFAEHHLNEGVAGTAPAVMIGLAAAATRSIRVGSGGVQMGHRTPLSVVEEFGLLDCAFPGRLDLGLGRTHGTPRRRPERDNGANPTRPTPESRRDIIQIGARREESADGHTRSPDGGEATLSRPKPGDRTVGGCSHSVATVPGTALAFAPRGVGPRSAAATRGGNSRLHRADR